MKVRQRENDDASDNDEIALVTQIINDNVVMITSTTMASVDSDGNNIATSRRMKKSMLRVMSFLLFLLFSLVYPCAKMFFGFGAYCLIVVILSTIAVVEIY